MPIIQGGVSTLNLLQDVGSCGGPDKRLGVFVVLVNVIKEGGDQFLNATKHPAAQAGFGQIAKEAFHHVQPRATGGREVHVKARVATEPTLHFGMFVGRVIVHDHIAVHVPVVIVG